MADELTDREMDLALLGEGLLKVLERIADSLERLADAREDHNDGGAVPVEERVHLDPLHVWQNCGLAAMAPRQNVRITDVEMPVAAESPPPTGPGADRLQRVVEYRRANPGITLQGSIAAVDQMIATEQAIQEAANRAHDEATMTMTFIPDPNVIWRLDPEDPARRRR